ncbi:hypothetical protein Bca101_071020 [Brassica carinata]
MARQNCTLIDTSLRPEDKGDIIREVKEADAIVLTFAMDRLETLDRLSEYWLLLFRHLKVRVPIVVAGYSVIQKEHNTIDTEEITTPIRQQCREIEICIEWSAPRLSDISWLAQAVFVQAQIAAMNHIGPVYDQVTNSLKPRCVAALEHIFELNACDNDYILSDDGLNHINARCFSIPLMPSRCRALIKSVQELCPEGVKENRLTVDGFLVLITKLIMDRKLRTLWTMLRTFGYNNDIRLVDEMIPYSSFKRILDQSVELTNEAIGSLRRVYHRFNNLGPQMMESLFETAPERPEDKGDVIREVKEADAIVLTFAMDRQESLDRLSEYWLPLFRHLEVRVPIVVAGYIVFYKEHNPIDIEEITTPIRQQCREIEICIEWSAPRLSDIRWLAQAVFVQEQIAAMHPIGPAYDQLIIDRKLIMDYAWTFRYNNDIRLVDDMIPYSSFKHMPDQSVELTDEAIGS